jgi:hypothetical protein
MRGSDSELLNLRRGKSLSGRAVPHLAVLFRNGKAAGCQCRRNLLLGLDRSPSRNGLKLTRSQLSSPHSTGQPLSGLVSNGPAAWIKFRVTRQKIPTPARGAPFKCQTVTASESAIMVTGRVRRDPPCHRHRDVTVIGQRWPCQSDSECHGDAQTTERAIHWRNPSQAPLSCRYGTPG